MAQPSKAAHAAPIADVTPKSSGIPVKRIALIIAIIAAILLAVYGIGCRYFYSHFIFGTTVNGEDVSNMTQQELAAKIQAKTASYTLKVTGDSFDFSIGSKDMQLSVDNLAYANDALTQSDYYAWPIRLFHPQAISVKDSINYDKDMLGAYVAAKVDEFNQTAKDPENATLSYSADTATFEISAENAGTKIDGDKVLSKVIGAIDNMETSVTLDSSDLVQPQISSEGSNLASLKDTANAFIKDGISFVTDSGVKVGYIDNKTLGSMIHVLEKDDGTPFLNLDGEAFYTWANGDMAKECAKLDEVTIYDIDGYKTAEAVQAKLAAGEVSPTMAPVLLVAGTRPAETEGARTRGRHLDINLSTQYARFYDENGNVLWRTYVVSGDNTMPTPPGTYHLLNKVRNSTLIGADEDHDGEPDYKTPVSYWMPFIGNSYGLHDAPWRGSFGGTIYKSSGSHGCVNLPPDKAAELYGIISVGDTIYIHN